MDADDGAELTPEDRSKLLVRQQYDLIAGQATHFEWDCRLEDLGDYYVVYVRIQKPAGRTFLLRLECDDYSRQPPLAEFSNPARWDNPDLQDDVQTQFWPTGAEYLQNRGKPYPIMCIRGHRDYYAGVWHSGWSDPPHPQDTLYQLVVNIRKAILDLWS